MTEKSSHYGAILVSFFFIYIVWGSAYLANAWGVKEVPPFIYAGIRFSVAGLMIIVPCWILGWLNISKQQLKNCLIAGIALFAFGNGALVWALKYIDSGLTSLITSIEPLIMVLLMWKFKSQPPTWNSWLGIALGITGMAILVGQPQYVGNITWLIALLAVLFAIFSWTCVHIWMITADLPQSAIQGAGLQMLIGGCILLCLGWLNNDFIDFNFSQVSEKVRWALLYLIIFASIGAFSAFNYLIPRVSPISIAASTYINPVVALLLGWWWNNEILDSRIFVAALFLFAGVFFINLSKRWRL